MKIAQLFILILAFLIIKPASAGVLIEPVLGYNFGKFDVDTAGFDSESMTGPAIGGRIGYQNLGFQLGLDYLRSTMDIDNNDYKEDATISEFAAFVGFEFPILLRAYAGYIFSASGETEADFGTGKDDVKLEDGSGVKLGLGFTLLPFVDINLEYRKGSFDEWKFGSQKIDDKVDYSAYMIAVSLPFVL